MAETAGAAVPVGSGRDLSAIRRDGLTGRLQPGERAIPGGRAAAAAGRAGHRGSGCLAAGRTRELLLPPLLRLTARGRRAGGAPAELPADLRRRRPHRLALRDFAGLRLHRPRLAAAGHDIALWPGSVIGTDDLGGAARQDRLHRVPGPPRRAGHPPGRVARPGRGPRPGASSARSSTPAATGADHAAFTAPTMPHKALVRMRLAGGGDLYVAGREPAACARLSTYAGRCARCRRRSAPTSTTPPRCARGPRRSARRCRPRPPCCTR